MLWISSPVKPLSMKMTKMMRMMKMKMTMGKTMMIMIDLMMSGIPVFCLFLFVIYTDKDFIQDSESDNDVPVRHRGSRQPQQGRPTTGPANANAEECKQQ